MSIHRLQLSGPAMIAACLLLQACGGPGGEGPASQAADQCVDIPDGYYLFTDGKFSPTTGELALEDVPQVTQQRVAWSDEVERQLGELGFDWIGVEAKGPVALVSGTAPDEAAALLAESRLLGQVLAANDAPRVATTEQAYAVQDAMIAEGASLGAKHTSSFYAMLYQK